MAYSKFLELKFVPPALLVFCIVAQCKERQTVSIACGDIFETYGFKSSKPLRSLAYSMKSHYLVRIFRVSWVVGAPDGSVVATVIYDRLKGTFNYYSKNDNWGLGNEGVPTRRIHWRLKRVTDDMISALAHKHQHDKGDPGDSYFSELSKLGARRF